MFAVVANWSVPGGHDEWLAGLETNVLPFIKTLPGFVSALFTRLLDEDVNQSYLVFDTQTDAERFVSTTYPSPERKEVRENANVRLLGSMAIHEVLAEVSAPEPERPADFASAQAWARPSDLPGK